MQNSTGSREPHSPLAILTELAVEGTSSFIEAQRIFLSLAQQENDLLMNGVKERMGGSAAVAMTDLVRRSFDTLINLQQEFLTTTSKQTLHLLEAVQEGKTYPSAHLAELAREGMENFVRAHQKFLDVVTQETTRAMSANPEHAARPVRKTELSKLAREAADLFVDAQKKVLDVLGQQVNVNLDAAARAAQTVSPARFASVTELPGKAVQSFLASEKELIDSVIALRKKSRVGAVDKSPARARRRKTA